MHRLRSVIAALIFAVSALAPAPAALADSTASTTFRADRAATEMVRLINGERSVHGLSALKVDKTLSNLARDGRIACPNDKKRVMAGRSKDMALHDAFAHELRLCPKYTVLDVMYRTYGYNTYRGEIIAWNNYPDGTAAYPYGCKLSEGAACSAEKAKKKTTTLSAVAAAMRGFMHSKGHRDAILGHYDRVGCGAWENKGTGVRMFTCLFSLHGPEHRDLKAPKVSSKTGNGKTIHGPTTFSATLKDEWRLASGRVLLDGKQVGFFAFDHDIRSYRASITVDPATLSLGRHELTWRATDAAGHTSKSSGATITFKVKAPKG